VIKVLVAAAVLGTAGGAGGGSLAAVMHKSQKTAFVQIAFGSPNTLSVPGTSLAAGDRVQRPFDLANQGGAALAGIALTTTSAATGPLDTDPINGLQLRIDRCDQKWKQDKKTKAYACKGIALPVVSPRPVIGQDVPLGNLSDLLPRKRKAHLMLTVTLPQSAPNSLQGQSSALTYTFTAVGAGP